MTASDLRHRRTNKLSHLNRTRLFDEDPVNSKKNADYDANTIWYLFYSSAIIVTCIKFLLIPAYYSTDLEVHRNWMAITYNKSLLEWYTEDTSKWTLDYPPFFAYFQFLLAYFAQFFDRKMLHIQSEPYMSPPTLFFLRLTVIISDLVYYYGVYSWIRLMYQKKRKIFASVPSVMRTKSNFFLSSTSFIHITLFLFNVGHLLVDHVHFQYNGFLNGILLVSMAHICNDQIYYGAFWFAVLLNFKHIYLYMAPAYFLYLFTEHCLVRTSNSAGGSLKLQLSVLIRLALIVAMVFAASFLPFVLNGQIWNVMNRMFPFERGLTHAYWAPNIWALYNAYDLMMARFYRLTSHQSPFTSGLVQQSQHLVVPTITPKFSLALVLTVIIGMATIYIWKRLFKAEQSYEKNSAPKTREIRFLNLLLLSSLTFYELGYHVHEKSILLSVPVLIPMIFVNIQYAKLFLLLSTAGYYSLFPLLYKEAEAFFKLILMAIHLIFSFGTLNSRYRIVTRWQQSQQATIYDDSEDSDNDHSDINGQKQSEEDKKASKLLFELPLLTWAESLYIWGFVPVHFIYSILPYLMPQFFEKFQFLPLMIISLYCSIAILYTYVILFKQFFSLI